MDFDAFLTEKSQLIGLLRVSCILIEARQFFNFLSAAEFQPAKFQPAKFSLKFLGFWHFEPQFSNK